MNVGAVKIEHEMAAGGMVNAGQAGTCGSCTMCCKLLAVAELSKPKNKLCEHCSVGRGCKIYSERPDSCRAFRCIWLQTQTNSEVTPFPERLRPDHCKVVLHITADEKNIVARVDSNTPLAWMAKGISDLLSEMSMKKMVLVDNGKQTWLIQNRRVKEIRMSVADADGAEHFQGYV